MRIYNQQSITLLLSRILRPVLVFAVVLDFHSRLLFINRRKRVRYLSRSLFQQTAARRR